MKKFSIALVVACLMALTAGTVSADPITYDFSDTISWSGNGVLITPNNTPFGYQHDINDDVDLAAGDEVISATLTLTFKDDDNDNHGEYWVQTGWGWGNGYWQQYDNREYVRLAFDGTDWFEFAGGAEIDNTVYTMVVDVGFLNDNGVLDVEVDVWNALGTGDVYLKRSELCGTAEVVPVPGAVLLGVLGLGAAGMKLRRRNAA